MQIKSVLHRLLRSVAIVTVLAIAGQVQSASAAAVPTGFQEYEVLGNEQHVYDFFNRPVLGQFFVGYALSGTMLSVVSATASSDNQIIYYDQWEDGFEADLLNPVQGTTLIFGDQNTANGRACDYLANLTCSVAVPGDPGENPVADDTINTGETLSLASQTNTGTGAAPVCGSAMNLSGCVPIPRVNTDFRFDGGDRILASGGPLSLVHIQEPTANFPGILGGAVEILPKQALTSATSYSVPVGEDTFTNQGGSGTAGHPFAFVDLDLVAFEDGTGTGTQVQVTSPGAGTVNFTLLPGQHWSSQGFVDSTAMPGLALTINEGTKVSVNKPVGGMIFASGTSFYATRSYALLPDLLHSNDYVTTAPGDAPGTNGVAQLDLYIHNPDPINTISITTTDNIGSNTFNIGPNSTIPYSNVAAAGRIVPQGSTVRLSSTSKFWGLSAYNSRGTAFDWGHSWLATDFLTDTYTIPHAPDNPAAPPGASPAYASATQDNTCIRVDFNNDGTFDVIGNGAGGTLAFSGGACPNGYLVNALASLKIYDNNAADGTPNNDITGARVSANKPIAMAYGLDTDSAPTSGAGILDLGYAIYPVIQKFLNPVLTIDKTVSSSTVPISGGTLTYRLEVDAYDFAPIATLTVSDLLPATVGGGFGGYIPGSTVITYPDLSTQSGPGADPVLSVSGGRDLLTWATPTLAPDSLNKNEKLVIEYQVAIPAGASTVLTNNARANGQLGGTQFFTPETSIDVVRTDVQFSKSVTDDGTPQAGELLTYSFTITNNSGVAETLAVISDPIPANTTFEAGTLVNSASFSGAYLPGQNAVVWNAASLPASASETVSFQVRVNPLASAGTVIEDQGNYESTQTQNFKTNIVSTTLVGPNLLINKLALGNPSLVHPGETVTYDVTVKNTGAASATNLLVADLIQPNAAYSAGTMQWQLNAGAFNNLTDVNDGVETSGADGRLNGGTLEFRLASLGPGQDVNFRFNVTVTGVAGANLSNQATISATEVAPQDTALVQIPISGTATVTGHLFADVNGNGTQDGGEPDLANVDVLVTDESGNNQIVSTNATGDYSVVVPANTTGSTTLNVDETDPDFPPSAALTTANDPQIVIAIAGNAVASAAVGYQTAPVTLIKSSNVTSPGATAGQTITYTLQIQNNSGIAQTGVSVSDALPTGTSYVANSTVAVIATPGVTDTFLDQFNNDIVVANGNDGNVNFANAWQDIGDDNDFTQGDVQFKNDVSAFQLRIRNANLGAQRDVNLSSYNSATLSFLFRRKNLNDQGGFWTLAVDTSTDGITYAGTFTTLGTFDDICGVTTTTPGTPTCSGGDDNVYTSFSVDLTPFVGQFLRLRILGDANVGGERIYLDDFQVSAVAGSSETRTNQIAPIFPVTALADGVPPNLIVAPPTLPNDNITLPIGGSMTITYQVLVNNPLAGGITNIVNSASITTIESGTVNDSVSDPVIRPQVSVEANAAGTVPFSAALPLQTITFDHSVKNTGDSTDSFALSVTSLQGWLVEIIDPATGVVIATDNTGDGIWDIGTPPNTGSLAVGASAHYQVRVSVPTATPIGTLDTVKLIAVSDTTANISGNATDQITIVDGTTAGAGDVTVTPDHASFATAGTQVAYTHIITNNSGAAHIFALQSTATTVGWTASIYQDSNGDGIYTSGVDIAITNTNNLANGASQKVFVVMDVPLGAAAGNIDTTNLVASFFNDNGTPLNPLDDTNLGGIATDTTTVTAGSAGNNQLGFSLSGGGTQVVNAGDTPVYPGQLTNTGNTADVYELSISASPFAPGQPAADGLVHTTQLWVDTTGNGVADTLIAEDTDGDGIWDLIDVNGSGALVAPGPSGTYNADGDASPDFSLNAGAIRAYEIRRPVDAAQGPYSDRVTLTATSNSTGNIDSVTSTTSVQLATRAVIAGIKAYKTSRGIFVEWTTSSELGTVGFNLYRYNDDKQRWRQVNRRLLPGLLHSRNGGTYRLRDREVQVGDWVTYKLQELEATGAHIDYGPFDVQVAAMAPTGAEDEDPEAEEEDTEQPLPGFERVARALGAIDQQRIQNKLDARHAAKLKRLERRGPVLKISIRESGLYRLGASELAESMGLEESKLRRLMAKNRLQMTHMGKRIATLTEDGNSGLLFYAQAIDSLYTRDNVYLLREGRGLHMSRSNARQPAPANNPGFIDSAHAEGNRYYLTHLFDDPDGDYWMWDFRYEDMVFPFMQPDFTISTPRPSHAGTATLTVRLHGGLEAQHKATISLNGKLLGDTQWQGLLPHTVRFEIPAADLLDGDNKIEIAGNASGDPAHPSVFYINDMDIRYRHLWRANSGQLAAVRERNGPRTLSVDGLASAQARVLDISNPLRPRLYFNLAADTVSHGHRLSFTTRKDTQRFLVVENIAVKTPLSIVADLPSVLRARFNRADWLIITASDMLEAAQELADYRGAQGYRTQVVNIEDIYDEFSYGVRDANAIWSFLKYTYKRWRVAPRYVVLAGEGSFDYKDYLGHGDSIIPTLLAPTADGLFPSDNLYADVEGNDFLPDLAIGRLPVINAAELRAVSAKIMAYEASGGDWTQRAILASDAEDSGGDFAAASKGVAGEIPGSITVEELNLDTMPLAEARFRLYAGLNEGRAFFNFFGHANDGSIGNINPGLMNTSDLNSPSSPLANGNNLPVITAFTCLVGQFGYPGGDALGELLLVTPDKGAAAVFSPSGLSRNRLAKRLGAGFYAATYAGGELLIGEAILKAQRQFKAAGESIYLLDIYNLLGDPATIMK